MSERAGGARRSFPGRDGRLKTYRPGAAADRGVQGRSPPGADAAPAPTRRGDDAATARRPRAPGAEPGPRRVCPLASGMARGTGEAARHRPTHGPPSGLDSAFTVSLVGHRLADRSCAAAVLRKGRSSWRRGTGGESRRPCMAGAAPSRISLPHIDFLPSSRSQERPRNHHPSPRLSGTPGRAGGPRFSRGLVRRPLETVRFGFPPTGGAARLRRMPVVTGRAGWVIRRTRRYALPLAAGPGAHGGTGPCHETPVGHRAMGDERPGGRSEAPPPFG